ncbi:MAG: hypothetical protein ABH864_04135 [archaeon]
MRKRVLAWLVFTLAILFVGLVIAGSADYVEEINDAFNCLDSRVDSTSLSFEEAVFTALANTPNPKINATIYQQKSPGDYCWPSSGCTVKATAQAALAKMRMGQEIGNITEWLKGRSGVTQEMTWFLQVSINDNGPAGCVVNYDGVDHSINIGEDMKITGNPGSCLSVVPSGYRMQIASNCLEKEFNIQCDVGFKTNLLYMKSGGQTVYVSSQTHGASAGAWTLEQITARCFKTGSSCDYEGSLWAATALYASGESITEYAPYLRALASDNERYFPSAFLVALTQGRDEHYAKIMSSQKIRPEGTYWEMPSSPYGRYYDTALAMLALGGADSQDIDASNTLGYLFEHQDGTGCWNSGNIRDTAFVIYGAKWLRSSYEGTDPYCGDGSCNGDETVSSCPGDCDINAECGDGVAEGEEACDGSDLRDKNCTTIAGGFVGGNLLCSASSCTYNTGSCISEQEPPFVPVCNDSMVNGSEVCDCGLDGVCTTAELDGESCGTIEGYYDGTLGCMSDCLHFNVSLCSSEGGPGVPDGSGDPCTEDSNCTSGEVCEEGICVTNGTDGDDNSYNPNTITDCGLAQLFCAPTMSTCQEAGGQYFPQSTHSCSNPFEYCCTVEVVRATCGSLGGTCCPWDQPCTVDVVESSECGCCLGACEADLGCASDSDCPSGKICNSVGICETEQSLQCNGDEDCSSDEKCQNGFCVDSGETPKSSLWIWIIVFIVLIILVVLGIVYRDKLRVWWFKVTGKARSAKPRPGGGMPPGAVLGRRPPPRFGGPPGMVRPQMGGRPMMMRPRPSVPPANRPATNSQGKSDNDKEMEETFKKLKEMSK